MFAWEKDNKNKRQQRETGVDQREEEGGKKCETCRNIFGQKRGGKMSRDMRSEG